MALFLLQSGAQPIGQFDVSNVDATAGIKGGELMVLDNASLTNTASETAAYDARDAYNVSSSVAYRVAARIASDATLVTDTVGDGYMFYLADDGTTNYGVLFGSVVGSGTGTAITGTNLGPASYVGSGKVTLWDKPGLYACSLDAMDASVITGTSPITATPLPGTGLYRSTTGKLSLVAQVGVVGSAAQNKVGAFVELTNSGGLVQTPARLFASNSNLSNTTMFDRVVFQFFGTGHGA